MSDEQEEWDESEEEGADYNYFEDDVVLRAEVKMMEEDNEPYLMGQDDPDSPETIKEDDDVGIDDPYVPACEEGSPSFVQFTINGEP